MDNHGEKLDPVTVPTICKRVVQEDGGCEKAQRVRVEAAWQKWYELSGVVCDLTLRHRLKIKIFCSCPASMYVWSGDIGPEEKGTHHEKWYEDDKRGDEHIAKWT